MVSQEIIKSIIIEGQEMLSEISAIPRAADIEPNGVTVPGDARFPIFLP